MTGLRTFLVLAIFGWLAVTAQVALAPRMTFWGFAPDLPVTLLGAAGLIVSRRASLVLGFAMGLGIGAAAGASLSHYGVSRSIAAFCGPGLKSFGFRPSASSAALNAVLLTFVAHLIFMFLAPPKAIGAFLGDTIRAAVYDGVLAMPTYAALRRLLPPTPSEEGF
ncbi:MAG TPA: hypothetical protein VEX38_09050 [Fimbriimonadaceae bacterium]|nr:hypothetical protein [Fimbriimonadaceae bacterium]